MLLFDSESDFDCWFQTAVGRPTSIQRAAWPVLRERRHALLVAPTGQGKSLAAWRPLVERLVAETTGGRGVRALHIAPLKALARDMTFNLKPLLSFAGQVLGKPVEIALRCGDTSPVERARQRRHPPEILSTTPESLFVLLGSAGGRRLLKSVEAVVIDELHAIVGAKRGAHLALSLARLDRITRRPVQRIGLSATAHPAAMLSRFLGGDAECSVVEPERPGRVELRLELPRMPLAAFPNSVHWQQVHERIAALAGVNANLAHDAEVTARSPGPVPGALASLVYPGYEVDGAGATRSPGKRSAPGKDSGTFRPPGSLLVFCQTRAQVERSAAALDDLLTEAGLPGQVGAHHGSLDTSHREDIEARFKAGDLRVLVSSASLELGLDLGHVDRVCQLGVPGSVNLVRQRAGRSGHRPGRHPCMHLFALTLNQLVEARALADALEDSLIDACEIPDAPTDVLAQHIAAMIAGGESDADAMLTVVRSAWQYRGLDRGRLGSLLALLGQPVDNMPAAQSGRLIAGDGEKGWRALADCGRLVLVNAGVIPEFFEYDVVRADTGEKVGKLDEEFAFESSPGQVVQLGRRAWRIMRVMTGQVRVEPADEEPAHLPFWFGEGPGRTRVMADTMLAAMAETGSRKLHPQALRMLDESRQLLGALPAADRLVIERFADPGGDRHIVLHSFAGARINRAWGLALRKRFCRQFNFELQAAATDDGILISLGVTSRFELADVVGFVRSTSVADVLTQALLDTPLFVTRFRWCANNALVLLRNDLAGRLPAQRQRSQTENLIACVFPDQLACVENLGGPRQVPDHPLVKQALADCLNDYMDLEGLQTLLRRLERGDVAVHAVDTPRPSPLAEALIHAPRHSYLDEAAAEERRTRNFEQPAGRYSQINPSGVGTRRTPPGVAAPVVARPGPVAGCSPSNLYANLQAGPDSLERLLVDCGFLTASEGEAGLGMARPAPAGGWSRDFRTLVHQKRAVTITGGPGAANLWIAAERLGWFMELNPALQFRPWISASLVAEPPGGADLVLEWLIEGRRRIDGPSAADTVRRLLGVAPPSQEQSKIAEISNF